MIDHIGGILCILAAALIGYHYGRDLPQREAARIDNEWAALIAAVEGDK